MSTAIQRLIDGEVTQIALDAKDAPYHLGATERAQIDTRMRLGAELFARGAQTRAVAEWTEALHADPENLTIRKQIWMARYPEKFHPTIDFDWQKGQLAREREEEMPGHLRPGRLPAAAPVVSQVVAQAFQPALPCTTMNARRSRHRGSRGHPRPGADRRRRAVRGFAPPRWRWRLAR